MYTAVSVRVFEVLSFNSVLFSFNHTRARRIARVSPKLADWALIFSANPPIHLPSAPLQIPATELLSLCSTHEQSTLIFSVPGSGGTQLCGFAGSRKDRFLAC
ncbi:hypothetical protein EUGRSUZ_E03505 [Eucalyptus grandis]|uniref:Uncharacterized protein n=2 Tax=Eucalyptus grandis TaxID=71139 RepID=A0ACC3LDB8_EUCGR|nr:hypothetical protein EUGRSUZ_E03505 [Eucalyptus grandis]